MVNVEVIWWKYYPLCKVSEVHKGSFIPVFPLEDSTSGLCHTPGTRAGRKPLVGSNPTSSAFSPFQWHFAERDFLMPQVEIQNTKTG